ncbi:pimeloyl-ACP methyl ester carboxylesterase [Sphingopyxis panaciterrae]|uniref:alpha/beta fold hydrolase n=1 Tax=Sphingopyxis panaciterrae TaxID=363841 RepID=UPI00141EC544|nr:alpha/beta hydrolase [Sphingopyxis panaciterrae]NIJ36126.1 pimeloyl-ACP methyl ester carboxylesterase [Sphingopyxis panaciterrae]
MAAPVIAICGIATDEASWRDMPVDRIFLPAGDTIDAMADAIAAELPGRFALCGHSMGGYVALAIAARMPERLAGFALLSSACTADGDEAKAGRHAAIDQARSDFAVLAERLARAMLSRSSRADPVLLADTHAMLLRCGAERFARQQAAAMTRVDRCGLLATLAVPALVLAGEDDGIVAPGRSREMAAALPDAVLHMIPGCGHVPQREASGASAAAIAAWRERMTS